MKSPSSWIASASTAWTRPASRSTIGWTRSSDERRAERVDAVAAAEGEAVEPRAAHRRLADQADGQADEHQRRHQRRGREHEQRHQEDLRGHDVPGADREVRACGDRVGHEHHRSHRVRRLD
jgi:hypothetical protein